MASSRRRPITYQRRPSPHTLYSIRAFASLTAETIWAWNRLHSALLILFSSLLSNKEEKKGEVYSITKEAYAMWHTLPSDSSQRDMVLSLAKSCLLPKENRLKQIIWLMKSVKEFSSFRNASVHVPMVFRIYDERQAAEIHLDSETGKKQAIERLYAAGSGEKFWNTLAGDLFVLGQFALALADNGASFTSQGVEPPSLHRPRLLSLRLIAEVDRKVAPPQVRKAPKRQRRASQQKRAKP